MTQDGWEASAEAWIAEMGEGGDFGRRHVLDGPVLSRVERLNPVDVLDLGCGEGRLCRMLSRPSRVVSGIDPTAALIARARTLDPSGDYRQASAEALPFEDGRFDLVIAYLSLIDMPDLEGAVHEAVRVLAPGGSFLIANLAPHNSAGLGLGWTRDQHGREIFAIDDYLEERSAWSEWNGIRVRNWHRPLSAYMTLLLGAGLHLTHFAEPAPTGGATDLQARYRRAPWFVIMEWTRPGVDGGAGC